MHHPTVRRPTPLVAVVLTVVAALALAAPAAADARIGEELAARLAQAWPLEQLEVVVTFDHSGPIGAPQIQALQSAGILRGVTFRSLPVVGALATPGAIERLARRDDVLSIHANRTLTYYNHEARQLSGVDLVQSDPALGFTGAGVAVLVNDSGIDATHADLAFGDHVVENVLAVTNLSAVLGFLPATVLEGQLNTDLSSGHGTHCAGSVGGSGARSGGLYRGVAPDAKLVGYGSGVVISILDAVGGIDYAIANRDRFAAPIRVISNSWGSSGAFDPTDPVVVATYEAAGHGIVSVFAAGNSGPAANTHNPYAQAPWVISVAAGAKDGTLADFSSRGNPGESGTFTMPDGREWTYVNRPTVVATGVDVVSTRTLTGALPPLGITLDVGLDPAHLPYYTHMSGTSMATPHVAGIVALLLEADPTLGPLEVKAILEATADPMPGRAPFEVGAGHVDAHEAAALAAN
ncbi:MAG TPA: S8 family serine peptidase [Thermoanaerobaculia bacterium]|nr:S8 family serine peptidase [Thermoanaerobaculia bacterium]